LRKASRRAEAARPPLDQEAGDGQEPAGVARAEAGPVAALDRRSRGGVAAPGGGVVVEVGQVGADDDQRLRAAPEPPQDLGHLLWIGIADQERHHRERAQPQLQEGQFHLERVLGRMGFVREPDDAQAGEGRQRPPVDRHAAERGLKGFRGRRGDPPEGGVVRRPDHDHAPDGLRRLLPERREGRRGDRAGVGVARVRRDERLGPEPRGRRQLRPRQQRRDLGPEPRRVRGIEQARHGGRPHGRAFGMHLHRTLLRSRALPR
jgi:hypothetical protein